MIKKKYTADDIKKIYEAALPKFSNTPYVGTTPMNQMPVEKPKTYSTVNPKINKGDVTEVDIVGGIQNAKANFQASSMDQTLTELMAKARQTQKPEDFKAAAEYKSEVTKFIKNNPNVGQGNILTKDYASYLPQQINQFKAGIAPALTGALAAGGTAAAVGTLSPFPEEVVTVPVAAWQGGKTGYSMGVTKYMNDLMSASSYSDLLEMGIDNKTALEISTAVGLASSAVEGAETFLSLSTLGIGKAVKGVAKKAGVEIAEQSLKKTITNTLKNEFTKRGLKIVPEVAEKLAGNMLARATGTYALNVASETAEEAVQEKIAIEGEKTAAKRSGVQRLSTPEQDKERIKEAGIGGRNIALVGGSGNFVTSILASNAYKKQMEAEERQKNALAKAIKAQTAEKSAKDAENKALESSTNGEKIPIDQIVENNINVAQNADNELVGQNEQNQVQNIGNVPKVNTQGLNVPKKQKNKFVKTVTDALGVNKYADKAGINELVDMLITEIETNGDVDEQGAEMLFNTMLNEGVLVDTEFYDMYKDLKRQIASTKLYVSEKDKAEHPEYNNFKKSNFNKLNLTSDKSAMGIDTFYQELSNQYPDLFPDSIIATQDQLGRIADVQNSIVKQESKLSSVTDPEYSRFARAEFDKALNILKSDIKKQKLPTKSSQKMVVEAPESVLTKDNAKVEQTLEQKEKVVKLPVKSDTQKSGIITNEYSEKFRKNDPFSHKYLDKLSRAIGVRIKFVKQIDVREKGMVVKYDGANGAYDPNTNTIEISDRAKNPVMIVVKHEFTHLMQDRHSELYKEYKKFVINSMKRRGTYDAAIEEVTGRYNGVLSAEKRSEIEDEIVSDASAPFLEGDRQSIQEVIDYDPTLAQKLHEFIQELIDKIKTALGKDIDTLSIKQLREAEKMWANLLDQMIKDNEAKGSETKQTDKDSKFSMKEINQTIRDFKIPDNLTYEEYQDMIDKEDDRLIDKYGFDKWYNNFIGKENDIPKEEFAYSNALLDKRDSVGEREDNIAVNNVMNQLDKVEQKPLAWVASEQSIRTLLKDMTKNQYYPFNENNKPMQEEELKEKLYNYLIQGTDAPQELWGEYKYAKEIVNKQRDNPFGKTLNTLFEQINDIVSVLMGNKEVSKNDFVDYEVEPPKVIERPTTKETIPIEQIVDKGKIDIKTENKEKAGVSVKYSLKVVEGGKKTLISGDNDRGYAIVTSNNVVFGDFDTETEAQNFQKKFSESEWNKFHKVSKLREIMDDLRYTDEEAEQAEKLIPLAEEIEKEYTRYERSKSQRVSINDVIDNLKNDRYRRADMESLAEQVSGGNWDDYERLTDEELKSDLIDAIESSAEELNPIERQDKRIGFSARPPRNKVLYSLKDSDGRELSKEQQEFFKDSQIRDEDGNLLVIYHGSKSNESFSVFKKGSGAYGFLWATSLEHDANKYANRVDKGKVYKLYADIKNPKYFKAKRFSDSPESYVEGLKGEYDGAIIEYELPLYWKDYHYETTSPSSDWYRIPIGVNLSELYAKNDGVMRVIAVRNSNQIKNVSNKKPTSDPDIRYSMKDSEVIKEKIDILKKNIEIGKKLDDIYELKKLEKKYVEDGSYDDFSPEFGSYMLRAAKGGYLYYDKDGLGKEIEAYRIGLPKYDELDGEYIPSYNYAEDKRELGISAVSDGWLNSLKSIFYGLSDDQIKRKGIYKVRGVIISYGGDGEPLLYLTTKPEKTKIKTVSELKKAVKEITQINNSDIRYSLKDENGNEIKEDQIDDQDVIIQDYGTAIRYNVMTAEKGGLKFLDDWLNSHIGEEGLTRKDAKQIRDGMKEVYKIAKSLKDEYPSYGQWAEVEAVMRDGDPVFSIIVPNGDYPMNIDYSQICKKRRMLDAVLNELVKRNDFNFRDLSGEEIVKINKIIKEEGFEIACALCFVDSKRYRVGTWATDFSDYWNDIIKSLGKGNKYKADIFNFAKADMAQPDGKLMKDAVDTDLNWEYVDYLIKTDGTKPIVKKMAQLIKKNPNMRRELSIGDMVSSVGIDAMKTENAELYELVNASGGSSKPKLPHKDTPHNNEILKADGWTPKLAYLVGGVRINSFSDFTANMFFDYVQMVSELSAKKLPAHAYTKEELFVRLFGMTGIKTNMSLVPAIAEMTEAEAAIVNKLLQSGKSISVLKKNPVFKKLYDNAGMDIDGNYVWAEESFPFDVAMAIQEDENYTDNVGTIAVGVSDRHILKLMDDPNIRYVIPYHKSGINPIVAYMTKIALFNDYTNVQNERWKYTNRKEGKKVNTKVDRVNVLDENGDPIIKYYTDNGKAVLLTVKAPKFDFYSSLMKTNDPVKTAKEYLKFCDDNGYMPRYDQFAYKTDADGKQVFNENYYKLLIDFNVFNKDGKYVPQGAVKFVFPDNAEKLIRDGLKDSEITEQNKKEKIEKIMGRVEDALGVSESNGEKRRFSLKAQSKETKYAMKPSGKLPTKQQMTLLEDTEKRLNEAKQASMFEEKTANVLASSKKLPKQNASVGDAFKRKFVDSGVTIANVSKIVKDSTLYTMYNNARQSRQAAEYMIGEAQTDVFGNIVGESLTDIFDPIRKKGDEYYINFCSYLYHLHNIDRMAQNKPVFGESVTAEVSRQKAEEYENTNPEFIKYAGKVYKYNRNLMQYRIDTGLISKGQADTMLEMYPNYVPTYRSNATTVGARAGKGSVEIIQGIKKAVGSDKDLLPLHEQMAQQTMQVVQAGKRNLFGNRLLSNAVLKRDELGSYIQSIQTEKSEANLDEDERTMPILHNTFVIYNNGERVTMKLNAGMYEGVKAISSDPREITAIETFAKAANNTFKKLVTAYNPMFLIKNVARDIQDASLYSKDLSEFVKQYPKAWKEITTNGKRWQQYQALGGFGSSVFDYETGYKSRVNSSTAGKAAGFITDNTIARIEALNFWTEQAPRFTEFLATLEKGDGSYENLMEAMYNAADVTVNFGRSGTWGKVLNTTFVPFFNPAIQGTSKLVRQFTETKGAKDWTRLVIKAVVLGIAPSIINSIAYDDDDEYDKIHDRDKDVYFLFKIGKDQWVKIPKGRVLSLFGNAAQRTLRTVKGEEDAWAGFISIAIDNTLPVNPLESNIYSPLAAVKNNMTWYGTPIEGQSLQGFRQGERYDTKTDSFSIWLGKKLNYSPKKINYLLDSYSGVLGDFILPLLTQRAETNAFKKQFILDSTSSNKISNTFYNKIDDITYEKNSIDEDNVYDVIYRFMNKQSSAASDLYKEIKTVEKSKISDDEKRVKVKEITATINAIQLNALKALEEYQKAAKKNFNKYMDVDDAYLYTNKEIFGAEYAIKVYNKKTYEKYLKSGKTAEKFFKEQFEQNEVKEEDLKTTSKIILPTVKKINLPTIKGK